MSATHTTQTSTNLTADLRQMFRLDAKTARAAITSARVLIKQAQGADSSDVASMLRHHVLTARLGADLLGLATDGAAIRAEVLQHIEYAPPLWHTLPDGCVALSLCEYTTYQRSKSAAIGLFVTDAESEQTCMNLGAQLFAAIKHRYTLASRQAYATLFAFVRLWDGPTGPFVGLTDPLWREFVAECVYTDILYGQVMEALALRLAKPTDESLTYLSNALTQLCDIQSPNLDALIATLWRTVKQKEIDLAVRYRVAMALVWYIKQSRLLSEFVVGSAPDIIGSFIALTAEDAQYKERTLVTLQSFFWREDISTSPVNYALATRLFLQTYLAHADVLSHDEWEPVLREVTSTVITLRHPECSCIERRGTRELLERALIQYLLTQKNEECRRSVAGSFESLIYEHLDHQTYLYTRIHLAYFCDTVLRPLRIGIKPDIAAGGTLPLQPCITREGFLHRYYPHDTALVTTLVESRSLTDDSLAFYLRNLPTMSDAERQNIMRVYASDMAASTDNAELQDAELRHYKNKAAKHAYIDRRWQFFVDTLREYEATFLLGR